MIKWEVLPTERYSHTRWFTVWNKLNWKINQCQQHGYRVKQNLENENKNCVSYNWSLSNNNKGLDQELQLLPGHLSTTELQKVTMMSSAHSICKVPRTGWENLSTCAPDGHLQVWWYQMLFNTILTSWWWAHSARNM